MNELNRAEVALEHLDFNDREVWFRVASALRGEFGEDAKGLWIRWGSRAYAAHPHGWNHPREVERVWRGGRGVGIGWLFNEAKRAGWSPSKEGPSPSPVPRRSHAEVAASRCREDAAREGQAAQAAGIAEGWMMRAKTEEHPYFASKGFHDKTGLVFDDKLLLPMRHLQTRKVLAVQTIDADGKKKFQPAGCSVKDAVHFIGGRGRRWWWCEGYATALSVYEALKRLYLRHDRVVCAFSANGLSLAKHGVVIADYDADSKAGEKAAVKTGLPWWMPPEPGDANDYMQKCGLDALVDALRDFMATLRQDAAA